MGPLAGIKVVEIAGIGPGPFCAMMLADMGADVICIERPHAPGPDLVALLGKGRRDATQRGRPSIPLDLKSADDAAVAMGLIERADALIEGFRPGVMERLGLGPGQCLERNPRLVYGRVTGWGQDGPLARAAGHDIDYIAVAGVLSCIGEPNGPPVPPLNLVADFGGGAMLLALGVLCALLEARNSGKGQVVDAAMVDGAALLMANIYSRRSMGMWTSERGSNALDGGAPWYGVYECADRRFVAVGAIEPQFYALLLEKCGIDDPSLKPQWVEADWARQRQRLAAVFKTKTRDEWCARTAGSDACLAPVLDLDEAPAHPHCRARGTFISVDGIVQPAPAPRFSRTVLESRSAADAARSIARTWGLGPAAEKLLLDSQNRNDRA
jgi:alpha-methylacyl-CoA racemase